MCYEYSTGSTTHFWFYPNIYDCIDRQTDRQPDKQIQTNKEAEARERERK